MPIRLRHAVGRARVERGRLGLRHLEHLPEHLRGAGLVKARLRADFAHRLEHARDTYACELCGEGRLDPGDRDEGHRGEVVDLDRARGAQAVHQRALVEQVALVEGDALAQVLDAVELLSRGTAHHAVHLIALLEQQLGQVGAVLPGDSGD